MENLLAEGVDFEKPSEVIDLMPCQLDWVYGEDCVRWVFWSRMPYAELKYQRRTTPEMGFAHPVVFPVERVVTEITNRLKNHNTGAEPSLAQFWAPIEVNGSTFLSVADQPFGFRGNLNKGLCSYRRLCLDTLIPIDVGPVGRVFTSGLPEYNPDLRRYSVGEFPLVQHAIQLGIHTCWAWPWYPNNDQNCLGVFEISCPVKTYPHPLKHPLDEEESRALDQIQDGLDVIRQIHCLPFAQVWILASSWRLLSSYYRSYNSSSSMYDEFARASVRCRTRRGKAVVGRAFSSQESCFCKDVTLLSLIEYPFGPRARKAGLTQCFAICLQSRQANNLVFVVECFLPLNEMVDRHLGTFLNGLLSTMKDKFPGFVVASGKKLGQRMKVEVVKVSTCDELDSFEIGQPSVQSLRDGEEKIDSDSLRQQSNLQNMENNVTTHAQVVPSCSSRRLDSFNCKRSVQVDILVPHPTEEVVTNRGIVNIDVALANDGHIDIEKDTSEMMQLDSHFEQPNVETDSGGNASSNDKGEDSDIARCGRQLVEAEATNKESNFVCGATTNVQKIDSQKNEIQRIVEDYGITLEVLEGQFGNTIEDAAKDLKVSRSTLKRIRKAYGISRWPHHKTRKVYHHTSQGVSLQGAEPFEGDQQCLDLSQEKGTNCLPHKRPPATKKPCDNVMTVKATYKDDTRKFKLTPSTTWVELQGELERRFEISLEKFRIKYQDEDDEWVTIATDSDLRDGMAELRMLKRTTMRLSVTPKS